ncbi:hypothetical protein GCM10027047_14560 [Rhodococcus aerolatus]
MLTPPILEIYVLWHPDDGDGEAVADQLTEHFHGFAYSGLAGGAVEVYRRSVGWDVPEGPPRALPFMQDLPAELQPAQMTVVVPLLGRALAHAVRDVEGWRVYLEALFNADATSGGTGARVAVVPLRGRADISHSHLANIAGRPQAISKNALDHPATLAREVAQSIVQRLHRESDDVGDDRVTVFVSHTKRYVADGLDDGASVVASVRQALQNTHLDAFFDAHDIQTGEDWVERLEAEAGGNALLMIRTDLYASREWTQREVLIAKRHDVPVVALHAVRGQEDRGSFLMDNVPLVACAPGNPLPAIEAALNRLVDEALKKALWRAQQVYLREHGFDWLPAHAPEPITLVDWLATKKPEGDDPRILVMHPDPPLGPPEYGAIEQLCRVAGMTGAIEVLTPRTFAARGGAVG